MYKIYVLGTFLIIFIQLENAITLFGRDKFSTFIHQLLNRYNDEAIKRKQLISEISWDYTLDLSTANEEKLKNASAEKKLFDNSWKMKLLKFEPEYRFLDSDALNLISKIPFNPSYKNIQSIKAYQQAKNDLLKGYSRIRLMRRAFVCPYNFPLLPPHRQQFERLTCSWRQHRVGPEPQLKTLYNKMAQSFRKCCLPTPTNKTLNFASVQVNVTISKIKPFYDLLHAYARHKLGEYYQLTDMDFPKRMIPVQLTENAWGQNWESISNKVFPINSVPFKDLINLSVQKRRMTLRDIVKICENYFVSLGLPILPREFWDRSILINPQESNFSTCYPSAWNMFNGNDFRIMFCQKINFASWMNLYHELGHIHYYMAYKKLPILYRMSPNLAFHESIGDTIALSALSPWNPNLFTWQDIEITPAQEMEFLMSQALRKIPLFMFAYAMEDWRFNALMGNIKPTEYNGKWWEYVGKYQGIAPPYGRTEENFDPAFKFHIIKNQNFLEYLQATIFQFQLFKLLCEKSGQLNITKPLHTCNLSNSTEAGKLLLNIMKLGNQISWKQMLIALTGQANYDIGPLLEYFQPLITYLEKEILTNNITVGWDDI